MAIHEIKIYEVKAQVLMHVQADSEEDAIEMVEADLADVALSWEITNVTV